jgi:hypothetical protein
MCCLPNYMELAHPSDADSSLTEAQNLLGCTAMFLIGSSVTVRHHLAGRELSLSSRYTVPLGCSYCRSSREHEFLDLREILRAIELLRAVKEN